MKQILKNLPMVALWAALFVLLLFLFRGASAIERMFPDFSLRFDDGISGGGAKAARLYSIGSEGEAGFWPTFWREDRSVAECDTGSADCTAITFSGDGALAWNADFLEGTMPGVADTSGCALSDGLALSLFGSTGIIGMEVYINEGTWTVRGVFSEKQAVALLSAGDENQSVAWHAAELGESPENADRSAAEDFSFASGLGYPSTVIEGGIVVFFARLACFLSVAILAVFAIVLLIGRIPRRVRGFAVFGVCVAVALMLPALLSQLPGWAIPDMWSDFSHWASLSERFENGLRDLLGKAPYLRDVEGKLLLLRQSALCFSSTLCAVAICFSYNTKTSQR